MLRILELLGWLAGVMMNASRFIGPINLFRWGDASREVTWVNISHPDHPLLTVDPTWGSLYGLLTEVLLQSPSRMEGRRRGGGKRGNQEMHLRYSVHKRRFRVSERGERFPVSSGDSCMLMGRWWCGY